MTSSSADSDRNLETHLTAIVSARHLGADVVVFPELSLSGYLVEDPAAWASEHLEDALAALQSAAGDLVVLVGAPWPTTRGNAANACLALDAEGVVHVQEKIYLPDYGVYTEGRRFAAGTSVGSFTIGGRKAGMLICEDVWHPALGYVLRVHGAELIFHPAASPRSGIGSSFSSERGWQTVNRAQALYAGAFVVFVNQVGFDGPTEFWGGSGVIGPDGNDVMTLGGAPETAVFDLDSAVTDATRDILRMATDEDPEFACTALRTAIDSRSAPRADGPSDGTDR